MTGLYLRSGWLKSDSPQCALVSACSGCFAGCEAETEVGAEAAGDAGAAARSREGERRGRWSSRASRPGGRKDRGRAAARTEQDEKYQFLVLFSLLVRDCNRVGSLLECTDDMLKLICRQILRF